MLNHDFTNVEGLVQYITNVSLEIVSPYAWLQGVPNIANPVQALIENISLEIL